MRRHTLDAADWLPVLETAAGSGVRVAIATSAKETMDLIEERAWQSVGIDLDLTAVHPDLVARIVQAGYVYLVHLGNWCSEGSLRREAFLDEGEAAVPLLLQALNHAGYVGSVRASHPPGMTDDTEWGHKGRAFDAGYLKAVMQVLGAG